MYKWKGLHVGKVNFLLTIISYVLMQYAAFKVFGPIGPHNDAAVGAMFVIIGIHLISFIMEFIYDFVEWLWFIPFRIKDYFVNKRNTKQYEKDAAQRAAQRELQKFIEECRK